MAAAGASIIADGTIDGAAFSFSTPMDVEQELEGNFVLGSSSNLTLNVDASTWFGGSGSARLDPRTRRSGRRSRATSSARSSV